MGSWWAPPSPSGGVAVEDVDGLAEAVHRGLHHALAQRGVRVDGHADVFEERMHLESERALADEVTRRGTDDMDAQELVGLLVGDHLEEALRLVDGHRPPEQGGHERAETQLRVRLTVFAIRPLSTATTTPDTRRHTTASERVWLEATHTASRSSPRGIRQTP